MTTTWVRQGYFETYEDDSMSRRENKLKFRGDPESPLPARSSSSYIPIITFLILSLHHPSLMPKFKHPSNYPADEDPLTKVIAPPPDESLKEREVRLAEEAAAQRRSDAIDEELNRQRLAEKKAPKCIRILLLGPVPICFPPLLHLTRVL